MQRVADSEWLHLVDWSVPWNYSAWQRLRENPFEPAGLSPNWIRCQARKLLKSKCIEPDGVMLQTEPLECFYMYLFLEKLCEHSLLCIVFLYFTVLTFPRCSFLRKKAVLTNWLLGIPSAMKGTEVPNPRRSSACDLYLCVD